MSTKSCEPGCSDVGFRLAFYSIMIPPQLNSSTIMTSVYVWAVVNERTCVFRWHFHFRYPRKMWTDEWQSNFSNLNIDCIDGEMPWVVEVLCAAAVLFVWFVPLQIAATITWAPLHILSYYDWMDVINNLHYALLWATLGLAYIFEECSRHTSTNNAMASRLYVLNAALKSILYDMNSIWL